MTVIILLKLCFAPLADIAMKGMQCQTKNDKRVLLHLMLTSFVADIPKTKDLLVLKRGLRTPALCYICTAGCYTIPFSTNAELRALSSSNQILKKHGNASTKFKMESTRNKLSMVPVTLVLYTFPMVGFIFLLTYILYLRLSLCTCYLVASVGI